ncbi:hypothetical protein EIN_486850 [Entamoeba invadens IP1]|uniref:Transmembrane protein n=1 Tax=Entamoeba invadens IP1 TaxID=370355 RepID=A0A0A1UAP9_ENTIV|nr:hypothetical protein EIN_486850 [Entamoeba invadens IP1]ELP89223.1 hypothetical protein EIN_486850 [Entamoeba invadens IP1]|eukprot:XP_004255994.1 hypothetical protein EIN_486850 [Entamoeba invadens IP1]
MTDPFTDYDNHDPFKVSTIDCSVRVLSLLATMFGWIGGIVVFLIEKQNVYVRAVAVQSAIVNSIMFAAVVFFGCFYWIGVFFVIMFWITLVLHIIIIALQMLVASVNANSGNFFGPNMFLALAS